MENSANKSKKSFWFWTSVIVNLGLLGVFKYYNFFAQSLADALNLVGLNVNLWTLNIILPVGISFYTFHGLSYVIDIYKGKIQAERNFVDYAVFVSFFPLLVAGPIERATHLLPQIRKPRLFDYSRSVDGLRQILWGFFKKVVIADSVAEYANLTFNQPDSFSGYTLLLGALFFSIQIYCDFSGYSDIALGTARLFGIELLRNFSFPYFSRDIAEFWRRWHISLSTWFRDYLYIPLGGSKTGAGLKIRNTFIIFIVSGFWHGANWTFIVWGLLNAIYILPLIISNKNRNNLDIVANGKVLPSLKETLQIISTFSLTLIAWIFFRSETIGSALNFIYIIISDMGHKSAILESFHFLSDQVGFGLIFIILFFIMIEWNGRMHQFPIQNWGHIKSGPLRWVMYYCLTLLIFYYAGMGKEMEFIYFQF